MLVLVEFARLCWTMNTKKSIVISSVVAAIVAIALIVSSVYIPALAIGPSQNGTLSVMLTDPPTVPTGVTALYINYNNVQVHISNAGNNSGWTTLSGSGQLNLMSMIDVSQTIATSNINSGTFNAIRFNITSAAVTYNGQNYSADLVYQEHVLTIPVAGGIQVSAAMTGDRMDDILEAKAAKIETDGDAGSTSMTWTCFKQDFGQVFGIATDLLLHPEFRADKLALAKRQEDTGIIRRNDDPGQIAVREAEMLAYGKNSPYARVPDFATVHAITLADLTAWHDRTVTPNN